MLVATQSNVAVLNSTISTSKLGFFANNLIVDSLSTLSASGLGKQCLINILFLQNTSLSSNFLHSSH